MGRDADSGRKGENTVVLETAQQADGSEEAKTKATSLLDQGGGDTRATSSSTNKYLNPGYKLFEADIRSELFYNLPEAKNSSAEQMKVIDNFIAYRWNELTSQNRDEWNDRARREVFVSFVRSPDYPTLGISVDPVNHQLDQGCQVSSINEGGLERTKASR